MSNPQNAVPSDVLNRRATLPAVGGSAYQVYPATVNVADPAALTDGNVAMLSIDATGKLRAVVTPAAGTVFPVTASPSVDGVGVAARAVAPGAGVAVATIAAGSLPAGLYDFQVSVMYDVGAPAAAEINNMEFREGAAVVTSLQIPAVINVPTRRTIRRLMDGATAVSVNETGAATAGVGYNAEIVATRVA
jgi:hypothetical protein